ncbi:hypothetical protein [Spongiimicrobium salis]|uniref:hypothetical protein n=1 Tax=Spongiimicrobium salis TaxID=1667022 RepID=UPI00374D9F66
MEKHFRLDNTTFERQFKICQLPSELFTHEAHLRLAWIHIKRYGYDQALITVPTQLQNYVSALGAEEKYNTTLTIAAIKAVYHFMSKAKTTDFAGFIHEFPELKYQFKALIQAHYSTDIFNDETAKKTFLAPDRLPFD